MSNLIAWIIILWCLGVFGWLANRWHQAVAAGRRAAEVRHRRRVELALAQRGQIYQGTTRAEAQAVEVALPAAVIAAPPGATPVRGVPGPCRHEQIVPVIGDDGELKRWICKNWPRCDAEFPPDVAVYEPSDTPAGGEAR